LGKELTRIKFCGQPEKLENVTAVGACPGPTVKKFVITGTKTDTPGMRG
jgi:hypothetical protein